MEEEISIVFEGEKEEEEEWEKRNRVGESPIHWTMSIETRLEKKKTTPRRGIEPRSSAWQAEILTTILPRIADRGELLIEIEEKGSGSKKKKWFPCGESNPGRGGESAES